MSFISFSSNVFSSFSISLSSSERDSFKEKGVGVTVGILNFNFGAYKIFKGNFSFISSVFF